MNGKSFLLITLVVLTIFAKSGFANPNATNSQNASAILHGIQKALSAHLTSNKMLNASEVDPKNSTEKTTKFKTEAEPITSTDTKPSIHFTRRYSFQPMVHLRMGRARIVGGTVVTPHSVPFIVFLSIQKDGARSVFNCGGSIINEWTVVTAGHCISGATKIEVKAGKHDVDEDEEEEQIIASESFTLHKGYKGQPLATRDDIGLIHLPEKLNFTKWVQPVELAEEEPEAKAPVESLGWGRMEDLRLSHLLQTVTNHVIEDTEAKASFGGLDEDKFICADMNDGTGTCDGDSGGPLLNDRSQLVGATSFGHSDCLAEEPQCFASIIHYRDWIEDNIKKGDLDFEFNEGGGLKDFD